jgi:hypothetical protein
MFGWAADGMPETLIEVLRSTRERRVPIQALAVQPTTNAWIVIAP